MRICNNIIEKPDLHNCTAVFSDRAEAGRVLADLLKSQRGENATVLAIPAGGVPVAKAIAVTLNLPLELAVTSKMLLPGNTEAGFGAVAFDGSEWINEDMICRLNLSDRDIEKSRQQALTKVQRRYHALCNGKPPAVENREVILVDDGIASGATLYAAIAAIRNLNPSKLSVAIPTGCRDSIMSIAPLCDQVICANIRSGYPYAVASAYRHWQDVSEEELETA